MSELELINQYVNKQDKGALNELISKHLQKIYSTCFRVCKNEQDASDITQNVIIKIIKNIHKFKKESQFSTWAYRIAYNESIDYLKKNNRYIQIDYEESFLEHAIESDHKNSDKEKIKTDINTVLDKLKPIDKSIVLYFYYDKLKTREIAEILWENENTIKTRLKRAKVTLKNYLEHYEWIY